MNVFNAIFVGLAGLAIASSGVFILLIVMGILPPSVVPFTTFDSQAIAISEKTGVKVLVDIGIGAGLLVIGVLLISLQLKKATSSVTPGMLLLQSDVNGTVRLSLDSIRELAEMAGEATNREVRKVQCEIRVRKGGLRLSCTVALRMGCDVSNVGTQVQQNVLETVERLTGVQVIDVPIRARYLRDRDQAVLVR